MLVSVAICIIKWNGVQNSTMPHTSITHTKLTEKNEKKLQKAPYTVYTQPSKPICEYETEKRILLSKVKTRNRSHL